MKSVNQLSAAASSEIFYSASDYIDAYALVANTPQTITIPANTRLVSFGPSVPFYANFNGGTAAIPVANVTDGTASSYCPSTRYINGITTFSVISAQTGIITVEYYTL